MSNRRNAILLVICGLLLGPANGATPPNGDTSRPGDTVVTLPVGKDDKATGIAIAIPATSPSLHVIPSTLVSRRDLEFRRVEAQWRSFRLTFLMYKPDVAHRPEPIAVVSSFDLGHKDHIWIQWIPRSRSDVEGTDIDIATIEHLYGLALGQNPHAEFCLSGFGHKCITPRGDYPHPRLLQELSEARERLVARAHRAPVTVPWRNVTMVGEPKGAIDGRVGVRVADRGSPLEGATVIFGRAPHSGCKAKSSSDGIATCDLVDPHDDEDPDVEPDSVPILATFPGDVQPDHILLPTTLSWYPKP